MCAVPLGTRHQIPVAYLRHAYSFSILYQPLKRLATVVMPRWGIALKVVVILLCRWGIGN